MTAPSHEFGESNRLGGVWTTQVLQTRFLDLHVGYSSGVPGRKVLVDEFLIISTIQFGGVWGVFHACADVRLELRGSPTRPLWARELRRKKTTPTQKIYQYNHATGVCPCVILCLLAEMHKKF